MALALTTAASFGAEENEITIYKPAKDYTAYAGEKIAYSFDVENNGTGENDYVWPWIRVYDSSKAWSDYFTTDYLTSPSTLSDYSGVVKLYKGYPSGDFYFRVILVPYDNVNKKPLVDTSKKNFEKDLKFKSVKIKMKTLFWPVSLKLNAYKGKVKVSYSKAKGATKYEIYRSTKAKSGFKAIGTSKTTSFIDKKAKAGKTYFYYVKSVRDKHGVIKSKPGPKGKIVAK